MGGGAGLLIDLLEWLPVVRPDWEWVVYLLPRHCREFDDPPTRRKVKIEMVSAGDSPIGRLWWIYRELPKRLASNGTDLLFAFANIISSRCPVPQILYVHQLLAFRTKSVRSRFNSREARLRLMREMILRGASRSASVIVQTEDMRYRLECASPRLAGVVRVVPGSVSGRIPSEDIRPAKRRLVDECGWPRLVYVSYAAEHKNHLTLIRALKKIVARYPKATLLLTLEAEGRYSSADVGRICEMRRLVEQLGLSAHVAWLGTLSQDEVKLMLKEATVAVFPSLEESFGLPLAEAITAQCPLAVSALPYARDVAGGAAVYFDPLDPDSIANCVMNTIQSPALIQHLKQEASTRQALFQPRTVAEQIATILEGALGHHKIDHVQISGAVS